VLIEVKEGYSDFRILNLVKVKVKDNTLRLDKILLNDLQGVFVSKTYKYYIKIVKYIIYLKAHVTRDIF